MSWVTQKDIDDIRSFGVKVTEQPGWQNKSDGAFDIKGFMLHHDAMALGLVNDDPRDDYNVPNNMGRPGVLGSQFWASTRGDVVIMAAGGKGHAGLGQWRSIPRDSGNRYCCGLETDHTTGTGWSDPLRRAIDVVSFVIVRNHGINVDNWVCGHKEYAPNRKSDPENYDCSAWRGRLKSGNLFETGTINPPPVEKDWFEMATEAQLESIVRRIVGELLPSSRDNAKAVWDYLIQSQNPTEDGSEPKSYSAQTFLGAVDKHTNNIPQDVWSYKLGPTYTAETVALDNNKRLGGTPIPEETPKA